MREPLRSLLGKMGDTTFCEQILNGTIPDLDFLPTYAKELFNEMRCPDGIKLNEVQLSMTKKVFQEG